MNSRNTNRREFAAFHRLLMQDAPKGYEPHYIRVEERGKLPDIEAPSWKMEDARLTREEADKALAQGYNVALAAMEDDPLVLIDLDNPSYQKDLPATLQVCSRSNVGFHAYGFMPNDNTVFPVNITVEPDVGSVRSSNQYCLVPGSFVPAAKGDLIHKVEQEEITEEQMQEALNRDNMGNYVIHNPVSAGKITLEDLPQPFIDDYNSQDQEPDNTPRKPASTHDFDVDNASALYHLELTDLFPESRIETNFPHPVHGSEETGANFRINLHEDGALAHCYRCEVSLNTLQYLCIEAGYWKGEPEHHACKKVGTGWDNSSVGESAIVGDDRAIWEAWKHAKKQGYIPADDPIPVRALWHIARKHGIVDVERGEGRKLPRHAYRKAIQVVEAEY